jgi:hypothetical protein
MTYRRKRRSAVRIGAELWKTAEPKTQKKPPEGG